MSGAATGARLTIARLAPPGLCGHKAGSAGSVTHSRPIRVRRARFHASFPLLPADSEGDAERGGNRLASADVARRHDPAGGGGVLRLAAARRPGAAQDLRHRPRGAGPRRRDRSPDADHPVGGSLAGIGTLRRLRQGDATHPRPARSRHAVRADQRGDDHRDLPRFGALLQGSAAQSLPHPVEVSRRGAAPLRRDALARVPDEGRLFIRPRSGGRAPFLQQDVHRLFAHVRPARPDRHSDASGVRPDRRRPQPRVRHSGVDRRERGVLPSRLSRVRDAARGHRLRQRGDDAGGRRQVDLALLRHVRQTRRGRIRADRSRRTRFPRAGSRSAIFSTSEPSTRLP